MASILPAGSRDVVPHRATLSRTACGVGTLVVSGDQHLTVVQLRQLLYPRFEIRQALEDALEQQCEHALAAGYHVVAEDGARDGAPLDLRVEDRRRGRPVALEVRVVQAAHRSAFD